MLGVRRLEDDSFFFIKLSYLFFNHLFLLSFGEGDCSPSPAFLSVGFHERDETSEDELVDVIIILVVPDYFSSVCVDRTV